MGNSNQIRYADKSVRGGETGHALWANNTQGWTVAARSFLFREVVWGAGGKRVQPEGWRGGLGGGDWFMRKVAGAGSSAAGSRWEQLAQAQPTCLIALCCEELSLGSASSSAQQAAPLAAAGAGQCLAAAGGVGGVTLRQGRGRKSGRAGC